jgi:hypothetical protein
MFQARRSLLVWKLFGKRLDGWSNDDFPTETVPGNAQTLQLKGEAVPNTPANRNRADLDFTGSAMPPPEAVKTGKVKPLSDDDRLTLVRWIDLGCPIDLDYDPARPQASGRGWMLDDQRPTLSLTLPRPGVNPPVDRLLIAAYDYGGLDPDSFEVVADFPVDGVPAGQNLAPKFERSAPSVWRWRLDAPLRIPRGKLTATVKDRQGNVTRIERTFSAGP